MNDTPRTPETIAECAARRHPTNVEVQAPDGRRWTCTCGAAKPSRIHDVTEDTVGRGVGFQFFVGPIEFAVPPRPDVPLPQFTEERILTFFARERGQAWVDEHRHEILHRAREIGVLAPKD